MVSRRRFRSELAVTCGSFATAMACMTSINSLWDAPDMLEPDNLYLDSLRILAMYGRQVPVDAFGGANSLRQWEYHLIPLLPAPMGSSRYASIIYREVLLHDLLGTGCACRAWEPSCTGAHLFVCQGQCHCPGPSIAIPWPVTLYYLLWKA